MVATDLDKLATILDVRKYILQKYIAAKQPEQTLELIYDEVSTQPNVECLHAQEKCSQSLPFMQSALLPVNIKCAKELVSADKEIDAKRVIELTLDTTSTGLFNYAPGDTIAILPSNPAHIVCNLLERLDLQRNADNICHVAVARTCTKRTAKVPIYIPMQTTPRELLKDCLNLHAVPKKQFLSALAAYTTDNEERSFLLCLSSKEGSNYYNELFLERGLTLIDLLEICTTCKPTLALLVEHFPRLLPRPYSIANSPDAVDAHELHIIYSILSTKPGITTSMLDGYVAQLHAAANVAPPKVLIYQRIHNNFRYTETEMHGNQILIGVGTSLAPFFGFLAHKQAAIKNRNQNTGQSWLYAGAKSAATLPKHDFLLEMQNVGVLNKFMISYSRMPTHKGSKYVQELLEYDAVELVEFLVQAETIIYVCADGAKISKAIENAVVNCLERVLDLSATEAMEKLKELRNLGKYREDLW